MGFKSSPYQAGQGMLHAEEQLRGDPSDISNPFFFDDLVFNLPGSPDYNPNKPWVYKFDSKAGRIAQDLFVYVDDGRTTGFTAESTWTCVRKVASFLNFLGIQDAPRKRCGPSLEPGAWAGSIIHTTEGSVRVMISCERWLKAKAMITCIHDCLKAGEHLDFKTLESYRGYLVYISQTYPMLVPYLKDIHLTLDSWHPNRGIDDWKLPSKDLIAALQARCWLDYPDTQVAPMHVTPAPQLVNDIHALLALFHPDEPPKHPIRPSATAMAIFGFGHTSGSGFGSTLLINGVVHYRHGQWSGPYADHTSNFHELCNLVLAVEEATHQGLLLNSDLFLFTDNETAEAAFHKGSSSSKPLFELVLRLCLLQLHHDFFLHVIHVSGTRMKQQKTDGLSRGCLANGILLLIMDMLNFIPLHLSALDCEPGLLPWLHSRLSPIR
jgi:hypothetical protein